MTDRSFTIRLLKQATEAYVNNMKKTIIAFSENGRKLIRKLNDAAVSSGIEPAEEVSGTFGDLEELAKRQFTEGNALIFVGAAGIAVRAIAGAVKDKLTDSPVIVIDDYGQFVIPILSGHAQGANKIAVSLAKLIGAIPVITTSTDVNGQFSPDVFAVENHLTIRNRDGIKQVSAKALEGKSVTISIKDYPPKDRTDIIIADETDSEYSLLLSPKNYVVGIGMKKGKDAAEAEEFIMKVLGDNALSISDVYALATIDIKEDEPAIKAFSNKYRIPVISFEASVLERAQGDFTPSEFVKETTGVDNVCERSAILAAGRGATLICKKTKGDGITAAVARKG